MRRFFTSDTHFGHKNIIGYCQRPFKDVDEMNRELVRRWNSVVSPDDEVWHLGDFSFHHGYDFLGALNGTKYLVAGNHDRPRILKHPGWQKVFTGHTMLDGVLLSHKPRDAHPKVLHFHGHMHCPPEHRRAGNLIDVGVDAWDFTPRTLEELTNA